MRRLCLRPRIVLFVGLDERTAQELTQALSPDQFQVQVLTAASRDEQLAAIEQAKPHVLCCGSAEDYGPLVQEIRRRGSTAPFVVVSPQPRPAAQEWLAALKQGAADFFGPPFLPQQVSWIVGNAARSAPMGAYLAARA